MYVCCVNLSSTPATFWRKGDHSLSNTVNLVSFSEVQSPAHPVIVTHYIWCCTTCLCGTVVVINGLCSCSYACYSSLSYNNPQFTSLTSQTDIGSHKHRTNPTNCLDALTYLYHCPMLHSVFLVTNFSPTCHIMDPFHGTEKALELLHTYITLGCQMHHYKQNEQRTLVVHHLALMLQLKYPLSHLSRVRTTEHAQRWLERIAIRNGGSPEHRNRKCSMYM